MYEESNDYVNVYMIFGDQVVDGSMVDFKFQGIYIDWNNFVKDWYYNSVVVYYYFLFVKFGMDKCLFCRCVVIKVSKNDFDNQ